MAVSIPSPSAPSENISPIDALWTIYRSQTKRVRKEFRTRLLTEEKEEKERKEMCAYERHLAEQERTAAYNLAKTVKKGISDIQEAARQHKTFGRKAEDFLLELQQERE